MSRIIALVPVGMVPAEHIALVEPSVANTFAADVVILSDLPLPADAHDRKRDQYLARAIIDVLVLRKRSDWSRLLGIVAEDLYAPHLNFVFGEADVERGIAVLSTARLRDEDHWNARVDVQFRRRVATEAIHELGHTYRLGHCANPRCVMWFSNTLSETDRKGTDFCAAHQAELARHL